MKTAKAKTTVTVKKAAPASATVKTRKVSAKKGEPTEEQIRLKAQEIYNERISSGVWGTADDDWHKAETVLRGL
ncbi:MAG: hypothetical protein MUE32_00265 [Bacteroidales bacterium]|jgi:hypothetical protein|nr:hypothetical protein [Bacteroidales bacterium]